ncbi:MAG TPA: asparagine synthase C-terminal domain-containing protein [Bacteroidales bacterium]|nr:asparagine synthase C-terminal domain-containing protein [Bacteroidales bacterium]
MKHIINLKGNKAYSWYSHENVLCIGYFFDTSHTLFSDFEAAKAIIDMRKTMSFEDILSHIQGIFTIIEISDNHISIITDSINYFPVFYLYYNQIWHITDSWNTLIETKSEININTQALIEYECAGFVLDNQTLDRNILKTKAWEQLTITEKGEYIRTKTGNFLPKSFLFEPIEQLQQKAYNVYNNVSKRLIDFLQNRTAVVPLSGGFDSRLIVSLLYAAQYKNVICFTYGKMNHEVPLSKQVAETLGYPWYFIDYTTIQLESLENSDIQTYLQSAAQGYSMPYLQEYYAVKELIRKQLIPSDSVFLPGHSGDYLGGSYINKTIEAQLIFEEIPAHIESKYFYFKKKSRYEKIHLQERIALTLDKNKHTIIQNKYNPIIEDWDIQEKLSKFIFHSSYVFNYFGYQHYFPLWDSELVNFYRKVPYEYRKNKILYDIVAEQYYFKPQHISFQNNELIVKKHDILFQKIKDSIRYFFPWRIVLQRMIQADWMHYAYITKDMQLFIQQKTGKSFTHFKTFNAIICKWYSLIITNK